MSATTHAEGGEEFGRYDDDDFGGHLPVRPRRQWLTPWTALLFAVVIGAAGFYVGIRVEKSNTSSSGSGGFASAFASRAGASATGSSATSGSSGRIGASSSTGGSTSRFGAGAPGGAPGGFAGRFGGGAAGNASIGTVSSVDGNTIYVTDTSGNTIKVKLNAGTSISKTSTVSRKRLYPGDAVVVTGTKAKNGTLTASRVSDSGSSGYGASSSSSATGSSGSVKSAINSLFGGG